MKFHFNWLLIAMAMLFLSGCGLKGPLEQPQSQSDTMKVSFSAIKKSRINQLTTPSIVKEKNNC